MAQRLKYKTWRHKFLKENIGKTVSDINCNNIFLGQSHKVKEINAKINKWDLINLMSLHNKENHKQNEDNLHNGIKYL